MYLGILNGNTMDHLEKFPRNQIVMVQDSAQSLESFYLFPDWESAAKYVNYLLVRVKSYETTSNTIVSRFLSIGFSQPFPDHFLENLTPEKGDETEMEQLFTECNLSQQQLLELLNVEYGMVICAYGMGNALMCRLKIGTMESFLKYVPDSQSDSESDDNESDDSESDDNVIFWNSCQEFHFRNQAERNLFLTML